MLTAAAECVVIALATTLEQQLFALQRRSHAVPIMQCRQLLRICRHVSEFPDEDLYGAIHTACLARFLPAVARETLDKVRFLPFTTEHCSRLD
jgi:hypothetical protein